MTEKNQVTIDYVSNPVHDTAIRKTDGKLRAVRLWLGMLGMTPVTEKIIGITILFLSCHCCLISNAKPGCLRSPQPPQMWLVDCGLMELLCHLVCAVNQYYCLAY